VKYQAPRATPDLLPTTRPLALRGRHIPPTCADFDYREIRTPMFEQTELFVRRWGGTDIVSKRCIRLGARLPRTTAGDLHPPPEGTADAARYILHSLGARAPLAKTFYVVPNFRHGGRSPGADVSTTRPGSRARERGSGLDAE